MRVYARTCVSVSMRQYTYKLRVILTGNINISNRLSASFAKHDSCSSRLLEPLFLFNNKGTSFLTNK